MKKEDMKKKIILIVAIVVVLLVVGIVVFSKVLNKNTHKKHSNKPVDSSIIVNQEPEDSDLILKIYEQENADGNKYVISKTGYDSQEYKYLASYSCKSMNCKGYGVSPLGTKSVIYDNNTFYLYNYGNARLEELDLRVLDISDIEIIYSDKSVYGLYIINSESKGAFYNLDKKRFVTEFVYDGNGSANSYDLIDKNYFVGIANNDDESYILDIINNESGDIVKMIDNVTNIEEALKSVN